MKGKTSFLLWLLIMMSLGCRKETPLTGTPVSTETAASGYATETPDPVPEAAPQLDVGSAAPEYESRWLNGQPFRLSEQKGKVTLVNIWATWCGPCRFEIPELQALHTELAPRGFQVVGISVDDAGMESDIRKFVASSKITYPIVHDAEGRISNLFSSTVLPTSALIDRQGRIRWVHYGPVSRKDQELRKALSEAL